MTLPNFLGIGVQRGGTTWLFENLRQHPEIFLSPKKEIRFFEENWELGMEWYKAHFDQARGQKAIGEITPSYFHPTPIQRIKETVPAARLIVILREPVDRAVSAYRLYKTRHYRGMSFPEACKQNSELLVRLGMYADSMHCLLEHFPREQIQMFRYEEIASRPTELLKDVFKFLGVDPSFTPEAHDRVYNHVLFPTTQRVLKKLGLSFVVQALKGSRLGDSIKRTHFRASKKGGRRDIDPAFAAELKARFRPDILETQSLTGIDLSSWL
jgi:hypothetical protein